MTTHTNQPGKPPRVLYGLNSTLLVLIIIVILGFICYLTYQPRFRRPFDWTESGIHSLSPQTRNLLAEIDKGKDDYELASTFGLRAETRKDSEQYQQVRDLIDGYVRASNHIKLYEIKDRDELEQKIKARYTDEAKPYEELIKEWNNTLAPSIKDFFRTQADDLNKLADNKAVPEQELKALAAVQTSFKTTLPERIDTATKKVNGYVKDYTVPKWSQAVSTITAQLEVIITQLKALSNPELAAEFSKPVQQYFNAAAKNCSAYQEQLQQYKDRLDKLSPLKMEDVANSIGAGNIIVFGPGSVRVINSNDVYRAQRGAEDETTGESKSSFEGEQAISSALLALSRPTKSKVVFIGLSAQAGAQYSEIKDLLGKANYESLDWSPPGPQMNPNEPPPSAEPPASGKNVVWVVFPPEAPNMQMMMMGMPPPDPKPIVDAVQKHLAAGGSVMFLAEGASPMGMFGGPASGYPYAELLKPFGIEVKSNVWVMQNMPGSRGSVPRPRPQVEVSHFKANHPIVKPLESLNTIFAGFSNQMGVSGVPTVVEVSNPKPADADPVVIVETEKNPEVWGETSPGPTAKFDAGQDMTSPLPLAVASSLKTGGKVVVIGSKNLVSNEILQYTMPQVSGNGISMVQIFPGNSELFLNSVHWLSGYDNMIAVSAKAGAALRIKPIDETKLRWIDWGILWAGAPLLALIIGGVVFAVRRHG